MMKRIHDVISVTAKMNSISSVIKVMEVSRVETLSSLDSPGMVYFTDWSCFEGYCLAFGLGPEG